MTTRTCKVGIHGRNHEDWHDLDFRVLLEAGAEVVKAMSQTRPHHFERIKRENPNVEIITRLHGDGFGVNSHPSPDQFANQMIPIMANLRPYCTKYQVHNEPNHVARYEGWGATDGDATDFNSWFLEVYRRLKDAHPWASIGFPGLALPHFGHRDWQWLDICRPAIERADWLGVHCYWQTPPGKPSVMMDAAFGLNFRHYHEKYPNKTLEILECGNSNIQNNLPISDEEIANEYVQWLQEVFKHPYVNSASFFLLSSQDTEHWAFFSWRTEDGAVKPVVRRVKDMFRPDLQPINTPIIPTKPVQPITTPPGLTNQMVINAFNRASLKLGLGDWDLMTSAGLDVKVLARDQDTRRAPYTGPKLDQLPGLTDDQRRLIRAELPDDVSFAMVGGFAGFLKDADDLLVITMAMPKAIEFHHPVGSLETRVARAWNRYGNMLVQIADRFGIDLELAVAALASGADPRGLTADNRLVLRFEPHLFFERWGREHAKRFADHFQLDPARPWQGHRWRPSASAAWQEVHENLASERAAFELARSLDKTAACAATVLGFPRMLGASYALAGYESPAQMADAFASSERFQVLAFFDLIAGPTGSSRALEALRSNDLERYATLRAAPGDAARLAGAMRDAAAAFRRLSSQ